MLPRRVQFEYRNGIPTLVNAGAFTRVGRNLNFTTFRPRSPFMERGR